MTPEQEAILRASRERRASQPQVPHSAEDVDPTIKSNIQIDPSEHDPLLPWAGKKLLSTGIGVGRNIAGTIDMGLTAGNVLLNDIRSLTGQKVSQNDVVSPARNLYDKYAPAVPGEGAGKRLRVGG